MSVFVYLNNLHRNSQKTSLSLRVSFLLVFFSSYSSTAHRIFSRFVYFTWNIKRRLYICNNGMLCAARVSFKLPQKLLSSTKCFGNGRERELAAAAAKRNLREPCSATATQKQSD